MPRTLRFSILALLTLAVLPACGGSSGGGGGPANAAPALAAVGNQAAYLDRDFFLNLASNATDDHDTAQTLHFAVTAGPGAFVGSLYHHHFTGLGTFPVTVAITDASGLTDSATFDVAVSPNPADPMSFPAGTVFVSTSHPNAADIVANGTLAAPVRTIAYGIARADATSANQVVVASGYYPEAITLVAGIDVLGGYDALFSVRDVDAHAAILAGDPMGASNRTVTCEGIAVPTALEGFVIWGASPVAAGSSSIAVRVSDCGSALTITGNLILGGRAADGTNGLTGPNGPDGQDGADGLPPITDGGNRQGGDGGNGPGNFGGNGGSADGPVFGNFTPEAAGNGGYDGGGALGGFGGAPGPGGFNVRWISATVVEVGFPGYGHRGDDATSGQNGPGGSGGLPGGSLSAGAWLTNAGSNGVSGGNGGGGGGGGAAGGASDPFDFRPESGTVGASGGGGGSGGVGGGFGTLGTGGGASFGVFVTSSNGVFPTIAGNTIRLGRGGRGGWGGWGGPGGKGGEGGEGGEADPVTFWYLRNAGDGGRGGDAGHGGGGGGGSGGDVFGLQAHGIPAGTEATWSAMNIIDAAPAIPGAGGPGGLSYGNSGATGATGGTGAVRIVP